MVFFILEFTVSKQWRPADQMPHSVASDKGLHCLHIKSNNYMG